MKTLVITALSVMATVTASAAPTTVSDIRGAALSHSAVLGIEKARSERLGHEIGTARAGLLPRVDAVAGLTSWAEASPRRALRVRPEHADRIELTVEQTLFQGGALYQGYRQSRLNARAGRSALTAKRHEVIHLAGTLTYDLLEARQSVITAEAELSRRQAHARAAKARFKVGVITSAELLRARSEEAAAVSGRAQAGRRALTYRRRLERLTGLDLAAEISDPAPLAWPDGTMGGLVKKAEGAPAVQSAEQSAAAADAGVKRARGLFGPGVFIGGAWRRRGESPQTLSFVRNETVGFLEARWRLFSGGERVASERSARALLNERDESARNAREGARLAVGTSWDAARSAETAFKAEEERLETAHAAYDKVKKRYGAGLDSMLSLHDSAAALKRAESTHRTAQFDRERALLDLYRAIGEIESIFL